MKYDYELNFYECHRIFYFILKMGIVFLFSKNCVNKFIDIGKMIYMFVFEHNKYIYFYIQNEWFYIVFNIYIIN